MDHFYDFAPEQSGSESLTLETEFNDNGDDCEEGIFLTHTLTLHSHGNSASFNLSGIELTPEKLRQLADQLEIARHKFIHERL